jgi:ubiquinone/menaquinone biosynthesis C-methylase UbiE
MQFYDDAGVFTTYLHRRSRTESPNETLEKPVIMELVGAATGLDVLDLGCGDAMFGRELLACGAASYLGIDGSVNMFKSAQENLADTTGRVVHANMSVWSYPENSFDLIISRLAFHYIQNLGELLAKTYGALRAGGRLVFSVEHPVITSSTLSNTSLANGGLRQDWVVDDYFLSGSRVVPWLGAQVLKYHRTIEDHFLAVQQAGFIINNIRESRPERQYFENQFTYERRLRIPLFLFIAAAKHSA